MRQRKPAPSARTMPLRTAATAVRIVPGGALAGKAAQHLLDRFGTMSPRRRRLAVYVGAGVLGVAGVVEWPVALAGAAVAWLTRSRGTGRTASAARKGRGAPAGRAGRSSGPVTPTPKARVGRRAGGRRTPGPITPTPKGRVGRGAGGRTTPGPITPTRTARGGRTTR
ncbi:hypothetical protein ACF073_09020 [Streptomyces sp. NPDC015171]|uniref:hypothetical protein n=1 Tax=Streptomyces sp. NPDC015171 TaxID=3364945 RepID=UPI0036F630CB